MFGFHGKNATSNPHLRKMTFFLQLLDRFCSCYRQNHFIDKTTTCYRMPGFQNKNISDFTNQQ